MLAGSRGIHSSVYRGPVLTTLPVPRTRLLLAAVPPLLADIVRDTLAAEPEVEVMPAAATGPAELDRRLDQTAADVLLAESDGAGLTDRHLELMYRHPRLTLLLVSPDGADAAVCRLVPERKVLVRPSPGGLAEAVLAAVRRVIPGAEA
jgi:hypothetical protein